MVFRIQQLSARLIGMKPTCNRSNARTQLVTIALVASLAAFVVSVHSADVDTKELFTAAVSGDVDTVTKFIKDGGSVNERMPGGFSLLHAATASGNTNLVS